MTAKVSSDPVERYEQAQEVNSDDYSTLRWHRSSKERVAAAVNSRVEELKADLNWQRTMDLFHAGLYSGNNPDEPFGGYDPEQSYDPSALPYNVVRSGVDTMVSLLAKNRPLPQVVSEAGSYTEKRKAHHMSRGIEGVFNQSKFWDTRLRVLRDAQIFNTGAVHIERVGKKGQRIAIDRIQKTQILVSKADGITGKPRCVIVVRPMDRFELAAKTHPDPKDVEKRGEIIEYNGGDDWANSGYTLFNLDKVEDQLLVVDAYYLPHNSEAVKDGEKAFGGRHVRTIFGKDDLPLLDEEWNHAYFPVALVHASAPLTGFYGEGGIAKEMSGWQGEACRTADKVQLAMRMNGVMVLLPTGSKVDKASIDNGIGTIIEYSGVAPPTVVTPKPIADEVYNYLNDIPRNAFQFSGISSSFAEARRHEGLVAARALLVQGENEEGRQLVRAKDDETFVLDIGRIVLDMISEIASEDNSYAIKVTEGRSMLKVLWKENELDQNAFILQLWPTNLLGRTPAARIQYVTDLFNSKVIDRAMFLKLLDAPDINSEMDLEAAGRTAADEQIEFMLDAKPGTDAYKPPDMYQDLIYSLHRAQEQINHWKIRGLPEFNLRLLRNYIMECRSNIRMALESPDEQAQQAAAAQMVAGQQGAPAVPLPTQQAA